MMRKFKRRYDVFIDVKNSPFLAGTMDDYIYKASTAGTMEMQAKVEKLMIHQRIWTDGEMERIYVDQAQVPGGHGVSTTAGISSAIKFSAQKARTIVNSKIRLVESLYFNMMVRKYPAKHEKYKRVTDEIEELPIETFTAHWLLFPSGPYKIAWDAFIGILIFYSVLVVPMQIGFISFDDTSGADGITYMEYALDFIFLFDIIASFNTAYYASEEEAYVIIRPKIAVYYLKTWFWVDFLSTVPFDLIVTTASGSSSKHTKLVQLVKVLRLLRILRLLKIINFQIIMNFMEDQFAVPAATFKLIDMFFRIILVSHIMACVWWGLTSQAIDGDMWHYNSGDDLNTSSFTAQYVGALYWVVQVYNLPSRPVPVIARILADHWAMFRSLLAPSFSPSYNLSSFILLSFSDIDYDGVRRLRPRERQRAHLGHDRTRLGCHHVLLRGGAHFGPHPKLQPSRGT
jgi:hypothetical protein